MKAFVTILFTFIILSLNAQSSNQKTKNRSVNHTENCYCCTKPFTKGKGFFYYKEAGRWYFYEQSQDLLGVAIGQYSCSRKCAKECPVRSSFNY
jgi:hypothetical protein